MVIRLSVRTRVDLEALEAGVSLLLIRITANVRILTPSGWSQSRVGILDTGNPVTLSLEDEEASSPPIEITAYLLDDDRAPLLLGCEGILTRATLTTNLRAGQASLEF